uniref:glycosyltransferase 87 family protein n=1 Tax=Algoriphagus sp. TaxID=1872435 RepID=UPI004048CE41
MTFVFFTLAFGGMLGKYLLVGEQVNFKRLLLLGILLRGCLFFFEPNWSEDSARFLWDGDLLRQGRNPYGLTPMQVLEQQGEGSGLRVQLFQILNSPNYYSVYPPLNQAMFWFGALAAQGSVAQGYLVLRCLLLLGEICVFYLLWGIVVRFQLPQKQIILYWFNPLVILEVVGNLHFEGFVLLFLLATLLNLSRQKLGWSGAFWGLAVGIKLLPFLLAPTFFFWKGIRLSTRFWGMAVGVLVLAFFPLVYWNSWGNFFQSLQLYQGKFEFNASLYYLFRAVGYELAGFNTIWYLTKVGIVITLLGVIWISWKQSNASLFEIPSGWVQLYLLYFLLQPVVHPWYLLPGLGLSVLSRQWTFLLWSFGAIFSYQAYSQNPVQEQPLFLGFEYGLVLLGLYLDYFRKERTLNLVG